MPTIALKAGRRAYVKAIPIVALSLLLLALGIVAACCIQLGTSSTWIAGGLLLVGICGCIAGFGLARALQRSIVQVSVPIREAASRLRPIVGQIRLSAAPDFHELEAVLHQIADQVGRLVLEVQTKEREVALADQISALGLVAAGMAHELRNPLMSIQLLVQTHREQLDEEGRPVEDLVLVEKEIKRLTQSVQRFLDFARPTPPQRRPCDVGDLIDMCLALLAGRADGQNVRIQGPNHDGPVTIEADGDQIQQVLVNLCLNALEMMPQGGSLVVDLEMPCPDRVEIRVRDTGPGLTPEVRARLFEPFFTTKETGVGLGLAVSRRLVESHGGSLRLEDAEAGGTCFLVCLPTQAAPPRADDLPPSESASLQRMGDNHDSHASCH